MARRGYPPEFRRRVVDPVDGGRKVSVAQLTRKHLISRATYFNWRSKYALESRSTS